MASHRSTATKTRGPFAGLFTRPAPQHRADQGAAPGRHRGTPPTPPAPAKVTGTAKVEQRSRGRERAELGGTHRQHNARQEASSRPGRMSAYVKDTGAKHHLWWGAPNNPGPSPHQANTVYRGSHQRPASRLPGDRDGTRKSGMFKGGFGRVFAGAK